MEHIENYRRQRHEDIEKEALIAMKKKLAWLLILTLIVGALAVPSGLAEARYTASTPLEGASSNNRRNIERAAASINGARVDSDGCFSFNATVGPRTKTNGYVAAENARGVNVTGGGVSQVATTLYLALLRLGKKIEFTQLSTYGSRFEENYVSDGSKAVITDYSGGTDFEFVNHAGDMTIEMWVSATALNCVVTVAENGNSGNWFGDWGGNTGNTGNAVAAPTAVPATIIASASISCGGGKGTIKNVKLAAKSVNGTTLGTDELFSFNKVVGARTKKRGYGGGINGRGKKVTGGGVAQVASVIWLAVKQMDSISIVEKSTYGKRYNQEYVKHSADAILTDYKSGKDFSFRYKGSGRIVIYTSVTGDTLKCDIAYQ